SAMGFGGINCHVVLEGTEQGQPRRLTTHESKLAHSNQGAELFCFSSTSNLGLTTQIRQIGAYAAQLSVSELTDLAATLAENCGHGQWRAAVVAASAEELQKRLLKLDAALTSETQIFDVNDGIFAASISKS